MDYLLNNDGKMIVKNGDFVIGESDGQEIELLLVSNPGDWKENPAVGCSMISLVKSRSTETKIKKVINQQLSNDGFKNIKIQMNYPDVSVDANR